MPLLEQKREKREDGSCESKRKEISGVCPYAPEERLFTSQREAEKRAETDGKRQLCWSITALAVLAEHAERRQGNPLTLLIPVSLAKAA